GKSPKKITDLDNEKGALVWAPDSTRLLYTAADKKLYAYNVADAKIGVLASSERGRVGSVAVSPDSKWVSFSKQDATLRSHVYVVPIAGGEERHISDDSVIYSETNAVWTADGRYIVFTSAEGFSNGIASQGGIQTTMELWATPLRDQDRDPMNRDIDNEAQGLAAEAAARQNTGRGGAGANAPPVEVRIDWSGIARRARRITVPGVTIGSLTPAPEGHTIALTLSNGGGGGRGAAPAADPNAGTYLLNIESGQLTRVPQPAPQNAGAGAGGRGRGAAAGGAFGAGGGMVFAKDGRTLYYRQGENLYAAPINLQAAAGGGQAAGGGGGGGGGAGGHGAHHSDRAPRDLYRQHRSRSQGAARAGLQRGLAHHEEPLLRRQDARRRLERGVGDLRQPARQPRRRGRAAHGHDDDDRSAQRVAHRRERRPEPDRAHAADALSGIQSRHRRVRLLQDRSRLQGRSGGSRLPEDRAGELRGVGRRPRSEERRQLLAVLHARARDEVPLHGQRQAGEGRCVGGHDHAGQRRRVRQPPVREVGERSQGDGRQ